MTLPVGQLVHPDDGDAVEITVGKTVGNSPFHRIVDPIPVRPEDARATGMRHLAMRVIEKHRGAHGFRISPRAVCGWWKVYRSKLKDGGYAAIEALIAHKSLRKPSGLGLRWLPVECDAMSLGHFLQLRESG
ncbi:MAG: hypothetical protein IIB57_05510, partial [Planctomycetes bacterium]|nr:hypothetical protein [Planctomycetota bacterium]